MAGTIDRSTKVNLGTALTVLLSLLGATLWLTSELRAVCDDIRGVGDEVHAVRLEITRDRGSVAVLKQRVKTLEEKKEASK